MYVSLCSGINAEGGIIERVMIVTVKAFNPLTPAAVLRTDAPSSAYFIVKANTAHEKEAITAKIIPVALLEIAIEFLGVCERFCLGLGWEGKTGMS